MLTLLLRLGLGLGQITCAREVVEQSRQPLALWWGSLDPIDPVADGKQLVAFVRQVTAAAQDLIQHRQQIVLDLALRVRQLPSTFEHTGTADRDDVVEEVTRRQTTRIRSVEPLHRVPQI